MIRAKLQLLIIVGMLSAILGCGDSGSASNTEQGPSAKEALEDLAGMLKFAASEKKRAPTKLSELEPFEGPFLTATLGIQQKKITYIWGTTLSTGTAVVAHDANAESAGGYVLLQDGTVRQMTAEEFKSAPKAKK